MTDVTETQVCDEIVRRLCSPTTLPPDVKRLAARCGLELMASERNGSQLFGTQVYYDARIEPDEQDGQIASCIARYALLCFGEPALAEWVDHVADAVLDWASVARHCRPRLSSSVLPVSSAAQG